MNWVPGDQWAPAWVAWRYSDDYVGWAPLPPEADPFRVSVGLGLPSFAFSFVETRHFCDNDVHRYVAPAARTSRSYGSPRTRRGTPSSGDAS